MFLTDKYQRRVPGPARAGLRAVLIITTALLALSLPYARPASADLGPKPTETFNFPAGTALEGKSQLLQCDKPDCADGRPLMDVGPQNFSCDLGSCGALAYGFSPYQRLIVSLAGGKSLRSQVFEESKNMNAVYAVEIMGEALVVRETGVPVSSAAQRAPLTGPDPAPAPQPQPRTPEPGRPGFSKAYAVTQAVELVIAGLFCLAAGPLGWSRSLRLLITVAAANTMTVPLIWFIFPFFIKSILAQELIVTALEAASLYALNRAAISIPKACALSLAMNAASALADFIFAF